MFEFFKTLLIILWIYYALKLVMRWLFPRILPWIMKQLFKKVTRSHQTFGSESRTSFDSFSDQSSGFDGARKDNPKSKKVVGEYIDFEEVED